MEKETLRTGSGSDQQADSLVGNEYVGGGPPPVPLTAVPEPEARASSQRSPGPTPDGGLDAWLQVLGSWVILVHTWGLINCFGVFQSFYETDLLRFSSSSEISWIGSVQGALLLLVGVVSGPLYDAGYFRELLWVGMFLIVFGQFMTSLCVAYWQVLLAQGFCMGVGMGLTFLPSAAILSQYFDKKRALVLGISSTGSPLAGILFPILFSRLEPVVGFGWTTRVIALYVSRSQIFMHTRLPASGKMRSLFDRSALGDAPYVLFVGGSFMGFLTLYVPFFYIKVFTDAHELSGAAFSPYLVTLLNVGSVFGRIVPNALADHWGNLNMITLCTFASGILAFGWLGTHSLGGLVVFALLYGGFSGGVVSLMPSVMVTLAPDMGRVGVRMGMSFLVSGVAILVGTPIAGAILGDFTESEWLGTIGYGAAGLFVASILFAASRLMLFKSRGGLRA
ncbi:MFS general substrate transporter [Thozetella sp. PMI_491]|nr:MFS general substrate transporter [Thozetella sp. PMI_491]